MGKIDRINELEEELAKTKYNKRTQHAIGLLKAKIARLKEDQVKAGKKSAASYGYSVSKSGDATAILVGFPSVGKSTLLNTLTKAQSETGAYAFTTLTVVPGLLQYKGARIQILDVPGIVKGAAAGTGRGKEVLAVMRSADLAIIVIDVFHPEHLPILEKEIHDVNLRLNVDSPDVKIFKTAKGGIDIGSTVKLTHMDKRTIESILREFRINNAQVVIRNDIGPEELIDVISKNRVYIPAITIVNKMDAVDKKALQNVMEKTGADLAISAHKKINIEELRELIFTKLRLIRIYTKEARKKADMTEPLIMKHGATIKDVCDKLHRDFVQKFKYCKIYGPSAKFDGQIFRKLEHVVADGDVIEVHLR